MSRKSILALAFSVATFVLSPPPTAQAGSRPKHSPVYQPHHPPTYKLNHPPIYYGNERRRNSR